MIKSTCLLALAAAPLTLGEVAPHQDLQAFSSAAPTFSSPDASATRKLPEEKAKFERVEFKTRDRQTIHASFYAPRKRGRAPAALLVHDAGSSSEALEKIAESLQRKGFAVLVPDLRGHGESVTETYNWATSATDEVRMHTWAFAMRDLEASTGFLRDLKSVHNSNLSLMGVGAGAVLAAHYAVRDENTRAVALIAPKPEAFGFNILKDIIELGGLPVLIMSDSEARKEATRIQSAAADSNDGISFVDVKAIKPKLAGSPFSDRRLSTEVTKFLAGEAMPKR